MGYLIAFALILAALAAAARRRTPRGPDDDGDVSGFAPGGG